MTTPQVGKCYRSDDNGLASEVFCVRSKQGTNVWCKALGANVLHAFPIQSPFWNNCQEVTPES